MIPLPRKRRRVVFWLYAALLFTLTHWPRLGIEAPIPRPDLIAHMIAFSLWTVLLAAAAFFGPERSLRNLLATAGVGLVYAAIDESLQAIPVINRHASVDDFLANVLGVCFGTVITLAAILMTGRREAP